MPGFNLRLNQTCFFSSWRVVQLYSQYLLQVTNLQQRQGKTSSLVSQSSPAQCLLTSSVSHELFIETEIRNYVKEAAHKSPWLGIVNQSIPRGGDNAVETASQSYFSCFATCRVCGPGVEGKDTSLLISGSSFYDLNVYHLVCECEAVMRWTVVKKSRETRLH